jgi:hypothetical protein
LPDTHNTSWGRDGDGAEHDDAAVVGPAGTTPVRVGEFGPLDALADAAHMDGFSEQAVLACREWALVTKGAGDRIRT